ncbi:MAG: hypothetical protein ACKVU2_02025 [Saprospiraceae bacterium]
MTPHNIEQIEAYLNGTLEDDARAAFELAMQHDPELAAEVRLYRDMATALNPTPTEDALRSNLKRLGRQHAPVEPVAGRRIALWWWLAGTLAVLGLIGWLVWRMPAPVPADHRKTPADQPVAQTPLPSKPPAAAREKTPPPSPLPKAREPRLLAADFRPNPRLEDLMNTQFRGDKYQFQVNRPAPGANLSRKQKQVAFRLEGTVETDVREISVPFRVLVFSNLPEDYEQFRPAYAARLSFEKTDRIFSFRLDERLALAPGLYYFLIEDEDSGMVFHAGKVSVF